MSTGLQRLSGSRQFESQYRFDPTQGLRSMPPAANRAAASGDAWRGDAQTKQARSTEAAKAGRPGHAARQWSAPSRRNARVRHREVNVDQLRRLFIAPEIIVVDLVDAALSALRRPILVEHLTSPSSPTPTTPTPRRRPRPRRRSPRRPAALSIGPLKLRARRPLHLHDDAHPPKQIPLALSGRRPLRSPRRVVRTRSRRVARAVRRSRRVSRVRAPDPDPEPEPVRTSATRAPSAGGRT
jgi:hypothetical protein